MMAPSLSRFTQCLLESALGSKKYPFPHAGLMQTGVFFDLQSIFLIFLLDVDSFAC